MTYKYVGYDEKATQAMKDICPNCNQELPPDGLCSRCLVAMALSPEKLNRAPEASLHSIANYDIIEKIAQGGMGVVYKAYQPELDRIVALKMLTPQATDSPDAMRRFQTEAAAAASLDHPNIVPVYDSGEADGQAFYTMPLMEGGTLADRLVTQTIAPKDAALLLSQIAHALAYAHRQGILHRDIKPRNIFFDSENKPYLADFGLAKVSTQDTSLTLSGVVFGTPDYMPPEQAAGTSINTSTAADIYSLGVILYEILTGATPFQSPTALETLRKINEDIPAAPRTLNRDIPYDLSTICLKCLEKAPERRYATAEALADDLDRYLDNRPILARPPSAAYVTQRFIRRHWLSVGAAAAVLVSLLLGLATSTHLYLKEKEARTQANIESENRRQVAQFLSDALAAAGVSKTLGRDPTMMREVLDQTAERIDREPALHPDVEAELRNAIGLAYLDIDEQPEAEKHLRLVVELRRENQANEVLLAQALLYHAEALISLSRFRDSEVVAREAVERWERVAGPNDPRTAEALTVLAWNLLKTGRAKEGEASAQRAFNLWEKTPQDERLAEAPKTLASVLKSTGRKMEAEAIFRRELAALQKQFGPAHPLIANNLDNLGMQLFQNGKIDEAEAVLQEAFEQGRQFHGMRSPHEDHVLGYLAKIAAKRGDTIAELAYARQSVDAARRVYPDGHSYRREATNVLFLTLQNQAANILSQSEISSVDIAKAQSRLSELNELLTTEDLPKLAGAYTDGLQAYADYLSGDAQAGDRMNQAAKALTEVEPATPKVQAQAALI